MAIEKRPIDANALIDTLAVVAKKMAKSDAQKALMGRVLYIIEHKPTVDAVEVSRLGELGQLMIPYSGCPRGAIGHRGRPGDGADRVLEILELDAITDVDGNRWIPVLDHDLADLKARAQTAMDGDGDG